MKKQNPAEVSPGATTSFSNRSPSNRSYSAPLSPEGRPMRSGSVIAQYVRCGKPGCRCVSGDLHGPYWYIFWRDGGRLRKTYLRASDVEAARSACQEWRQFQAGLRSQRQETMKMFRQMRQVLRDMRSDE